MASITEDERKEYRLDEGIDPEKHKICSETWMQKYDLNGNFTKDYKRVHDKWLSEQARTLLNEEEYDELVRVHDEYAGRPKVLKRQYKRVLKQAMNRRALEQKAERKEKRDALGDVIVEKVSSMLKIHDEGEGKVDAEPPI